MTVGERIISCIKSDGYGMTQFLQTMSALLMLDAETRLSTDYPNASIGRDLYDGKAIKNPTTEDFCKLFFGEDMIRHTAQMMGLCEFLIWFFEEDAPTGEWFTPSFVVNKWHDFAMKEGAE